MRNLLLGLALLSLGACRESSTTDRAAGRPAAAPNLMTEAAAPVHVGTDPGHVGRGSPLTAQSGHELAAFPPRFFWGWEDAFRHVPGVTATAVGYTDGHTADPT